LEKLSEEEFQQSLIEWQLKEQQKKQKEKKQKKPNTPEKKLAGMCNYKTLFNYLCALCQ